MTITVGAYFALIKQGHYGFYHRMSRKHLPRYHAAFDFRWCHRKTTDGMRRDAGMRSAEGKRLMYREPIKKAD